MATQANLLVKDKTSEEILLMAFHDGIFVDLAVMLLQVPCFIAKQRDGYYVKKIERKTPRKLYSQKLFVKFLKDHLGSTLHGNLEFANICSAGLIGIQPFWWMPAEKLPSVNYNIDFQINVNDRHSWELIYNDVPSKFDDSLILQEIRKHNDEISFFRENFSKYCWPYRCESKNPPNRTPQLITSSFFEEASKKHYKVSVPAYDLWLVGLYNTFGEMWH